MHARAQRGGMLRAVTVALVTCGCLAAPVDVPLVPRSLLFGDPERSDATLSPDGSRWAYLAADGGISNVFVAQVGESRGRPVTADRGLGVYWFTWSPRGDEILYFTDDGDENWGLYAAHAETGARRVVSAAPGVQVDLLAASSSGSNVVLIERNDRDPRAQDVYRLDLDTGRTERVARNDGRVRFWIADMDLAVRGKHVANEDGSFDFFVRAGEAAPWRVVAHWELEDALTSRPLSFSADGRSVVLLDSRGASHGRLVRLDLTSSTTTVLCEDPEYDLGDVFGVELVHHPRSRKLQAVTWHRERRAWRALDPDFEPHLTALGELHPGDLTITSRSRDDATWYVRFESDRAPVAYYAYDTASRTADLLFEDRPGLRGLPLARMEPLRFEARDGLAIHGYATFPPGRSRRRLPVVVVAHGGPWARDTWGLNAEVQWLANRGYLVLNINFRGSTTYGKAFVNAADHEWGRAMLHDLVDAVHWAVEQGHADPERVGILGASFGGYQALCGATFAGDVFRCAVDSFGPSDLVTFMSSFPPQWETRKPRFHLRGGHPVRDRGMLLARSPLHHAHRIRIPVLIAHGSRDPRVRQSESDQIVARLAEAGIEHVYLVFENEGHGFAAPASRERFRSEAEAFLHRHLGGRLEAPGLVPDPPDPPSEDGVPG